jgi:hypothetical protein
MVIHIVLLLPVACIFLIVSGHAGTLISNELQKFLTGPMGQFLLGGYKKINLLVKYQGDGI